mmetsp:Transcript_59506/g.98219  ORF Transcript_59506/g.98219 Transcript_59506/m.98219 type:complete len:203 (+) Transcript_59506:49-657(+)
MGGPCLLVKVNAQGQQVGTIRGPSCTDNFQIIEFIFEGNVYYSAEQCFQSQKFKAESSMRLKIAKEKPAKNETGHAFGMRVWQMGQSRNSPLRDNYEQEKVKLMFLINVAKYAANPSLQKQLVDETKDLEIRGGASTWQWSLWNGLIQLLIRKKIKENEDLKQLLEKYNAMTAKEIDDALEGKASDEKDEHKENDEEKGNGK